MIRGPNKLLPRPFSRSSDSVRPLKPAKRERARPRGRERERMDGEEAQRDMRTTFPRFHDSVRSSQACPWQEALRRRAARRETKRRRKTKRYWRRSYGGRRTTHRSILLTRLASRRRREKPESSSRPPFSSSSSSFSLVLVTIHGYRRLFRSRPATTFLPVNPLHLPSR